MYSHTQQCIVYTLISTLKLVCVYIWTYALMLFAKIKKNIFKVDFRSMLVTALMPFLPLILNGIISCQMLKIEDSISFTKFLPVLVVQFHVNCSKAFFTVTRGNPKSQITNYRILQIRIVRIIHRTQCGTVEWKNTFTTIVLERW